MIMRDVSDVLQEITKKQNGFMKRFPNMNQKKRVDHHLHTEAGNRINSHIFLDGFILLNKNMLKSDFPSHSWQALC